MANYINIDGHDYVRTYNPGFTPKVLNNIFSLHRGDSFEIPIFINKGDKFDIHRYVMGPYDTLYVGIMEPNSPWEFSLIKKVYTFKDLNTHGDVVFKLDPIDTEYVMPGKYYLEAKIVLGNGKVYTILPLPTT